MQQLHAQLQEILTRIARETLADVVTLLLYDGETNEFAFPVQYGLFDPQTFLDPAMVPGTDRLAGKIVRQGSPIFAERVRDEPEMDGPFVRREQIVSSAALPVLDETGRPLALLFVSYRTLRRFRHRRRSKLERWTDETAAVITGHSPFPALRESRRMPKSEADETLRSIVKLACTLLDMPTGIWLPRPGSSDELMVQASTGLTHGYVHSALTRRGDGSALDEVLETGEAVFLDNLSLDQRFPYAEHAGQAGWRSMLAVPIRYRGQTRGAIQVFSFSIEPPRSSQVEGLRRLAELTSVAIENARRAEESEKLAQLAATLSAQPDFENVMGVIVESARLLTEADSSAIVLLGTDSFIVGRRSPAETPLDVVPRRKDGLTQRILETGGWELVPDTMADERTNPELRKNGIRSLIGVRLRLGGERFGVLYVESRRPHQFTERELLLLQTVADQASVALGWTRLLLEPWTEIEKSTENLYSNESLRQLCNELHEAGFEFTAVQMLRRDKQVIENFVSTGIARSWEGRSRHYLYRESDLQDIHVAIALSRPLRIEILGGWDDRFDRGIFESYHHESLARVFAPLVLVRDADGRLLDDWIEAVDWNVTRDERSPDRQRSVIEAQPRDATGGFELEVIGTIEAGFTDGRELGPEWGQRVMRIAARNTRAIHTTRLRYVLEVIVGQARRIAHADSASLHYLYDPEKNGFRFEVRSGGVASDFLDKHPPRAEGLGQQAVRDREVKFLPDPAQDHDDEELVRQRPDLAEHGIRAMAAFPLFIGEKTGVLYLHFHRPYRFLEQEVRWVELLARRAADAIRHTTSYTELRDHARQLTTLRLVVEDLVVELAVAGLLLKIARNIINILAADVVTIYEYSASEHRFLTPPAMTGRLRHAMKMQTEISVEDAPALLVESGSDVFEEGTVQGHPILNRRKSQYELRQDSFAIRESIESCAGVLLRVRGEIVGVLFVNYRRLHRFSTEERDVIRALSSAAAIAVRNRRVLEKRQADLITITHNLQSPLVAVRTALGDLYRRSLPADKLDDRAPARVPRSFYQDIDHALALSEDVRLMSSGILTSLAREAGRKIDLSATPIDIPRELRRLCERLRLSNIRSRLRFEYHTQPGFPEIRLDRETFSTVMYNLVHNAMKYAFDDTTVRIVCRYDRDLAMAFVEVRSTGERIEENEREKIFEKFRKAATIERTGRHHSGVGLGLWSARESIRATDGELRLELSSTEPQEAAFIVEIPMTG